MRINIPRSDRKYKMCSLYVIKNEEHFLLVFRKYDEFRRNVFKLYILQTAKF